MMPAKHVECAEEILRDMLAAGEDMSCSECGESGRVNIRLALDTKMVDGEELIRAAYVYACHYCDHIIYDTRDEGDA